MTGDLPTPADYDGDGKTDFSVWRPNAARANRVFFTCIRRPAAFGDGLGKCDDEDPGEFAANAINFKNFGFSNFY